jgi:hypothetical protein
MNLLPLKIMFLITIVVLWIGVLNLRATKGMIRLYDENEIYLNLFVLFRISADTTKFQL